MRARENRARAACVALLALLMSGSVYAHSASDAYLTLTATTREGSDRAGGITAQGQWDIALRDLDFVLGLDDNGDGRILWGELRRHRNEIARYSYAKIHVTAGGNNCTVEPTRQMVDYHADGAYAALFFDIRCEGAPTRMSFDYRLFFDIDPSHRGILVMHSGSDIATSVLSPDNARIDLQLQGPSRREK